MSRISLKSESYDILYFIYTHYACALTCMLLRALFSFRPPFAKEVGRGSRLKELAQQHSYLKVHGIEMLEIHAERVLGLHFPRAPAVALLAGALGGVGQDHVPDLLGYQLLGLQTATNTLR